jgi:hypothetical protein
VEYLYYLTDIFSPNYVAKYNGLFFNPLCNSTTANCALYGQNQGLNDVLFYYFDYAVGKYELYNATPPTLASARNTLTIQK